MNKLTQINFVAFFSNRQLHTISDEMFSEVEDFLEDVGFEEPEKELFWYLDRRELVRPSPCVPYVLRMLYSLWLVSPVVMSAIVQFHIVVRFAVYALGSFGGNAQHYVLNVACVARREARM